MSLATLRARAEERLAVARLYVDDVTRDDVQFIADFLSTLDAQDAQDAADTATLHELAARRATASLAADRPAHATAAAAVTTQEDIDSINRMARGRGQFTALLVGTHTDVWEDFRVGGRCSVCGMTPTQAKDAGYDCTREC